MMDITIFLAKALGLFFIIMSVGLFMNKERMSVAVKQIMNNESALFLLGVVTLIIGILLVLSHSIFVLDKTLVITILAWLIFLGGVMRIVFPSTVVKWMAKFDDVRCYKVSALIMLLLGLYLAFIGFHVVIMA